MGVCFCVLRVRFVLFEIFGAVLNHLPKLSEIFLSSGLPFAGFLIEI